MIPTDAAALAALETQLRQLTHALERLRGVRAQLVPATATFWTGRAREGYDRAVHELDRDLGAALEVIGFAHRNTRLAIAEVESRG